ncbi:aminoacyl-tRNA hydrolase [Candidatus Tisiphia endosymbiont of Nemotelus uliginosus]|uniref:aminoacyl-tRNA hydrolase n=1 Tax=Candidatus Tisiphia endosymbiont of Nemotelus uliginosus TaxID=3077926 RepID=UPI0035C91C7E
MKLVVGLGNTGIDYQNTRHNAGFSAVDFLSHHYDLPWAIKPKFHSELAQGVIGEHKILVAKPLTYMNLSGIAVQTIRLYYGIKPQDIFVLHDDIDLEVGRIKYKLGGGHGGHNGLKSLDQHIGNNYHRVRIGVGRPLLHQNVANYVLAPFTKEESKIIGRSIKIVIDNFHFLFSQEWEKFNNGMIRQDANISP